MRMPERIADLIVRRYGLTPPVDVRSLVNEYADLDELTWPFECDAMVHGLSAPGRPKIFLRDNQPPRRKRFTLGHELGHVLIPWHIESLACHIKRYSWSADGNESEANRFASHLLAPTAFLKNLTAASNEVAAWLDGLQACEISAHAGLLALRRVLLAGYVFLLENADDLVEISSRGSSIKLPWESGIPQYSQFESLSFKHGRVLHQERWVRWYQFVDVTPPRKNQTGDPRNTTQLLRDVLERDGATTSDGRQKLNVINGIVGGQLRARSDLGAGEMLGILKFRFSADSQFRHLLDDPDFLSYLERKATELKKSPE